LYEFTWNAYCDWFLELAKPALQGDDARAADSTRHTLLHVLEATLRMLHPLIPFVTEEIWQSVAPKLGLSESSVSVRSYPQATATSTADSEAEAGIEWLKSAVTQLRSIRSQMNVAPSKQVPLLLQGGDAADHDHVERYEAAIKFLARVDSIAWLEKDAAPPLASAALVGELKLLIPLGGLIDLDAEIVRIDKEIARVQAEIRKCEAKLANETFVQNAPVAVVGQERARLVEWTTQRDALRDQRGRLG
jgi:valyl-tRNA synthetase